MRIKTTTKTEYQQRMNVLVEYINNHLGEDIDLNKLAEISGFSRWHFHRIFAEFLGEPVGTLLCLRFFASFMGFLQMNIETIKIM